MNYLENQYDETTDAFSKWLGDKIKVSLKKDKLCFRPI